MNRTDLEQKKIKTQTEQNGIFWIFWFLYSTLY
jgi:hypothetical protein